MFFPISKRCMYAVLQPVKRTQLRIIDIGCVHTSKNTVCFISYHCPYEDVSNLGNINNNRFHHSNIDESCRPMVLCAFTILTSSRRHSLRKKQACEKRELKRAFILGARVRSRGIRVKQRCLFLKFFLERLSRSHPLFFSLSLPLQTPVKEDRVPRQKQTRAFENDNLRHHSAQQTSKHA